MHNHHSSIKLPPSSGNKPKPTAWPAVVPASSTVKGQTAGYTQRELPLVTKKLKKKEKKWNCTQYRWKRWGANSMCTWLVQFEVSMNCRRLCLRVCILLTSIWRPITSLRQMLLLFAPFGGCSNTILCGLTYPKILFTPEKERKKDRKWRVA